MNNLEKRFLLDSRFTGNEKLICFLVWANDMPTKNDYISNATGLNTFEINEAIKLLIEKEIVDNSPKVFSVKSLKDIYG
jgi:hypothetical protein